MDLQTVLEQVLSPDPHVQKAAENALANYLGSKYERTIVALTDVARSPEVPDTLRQSAALAFKNALTSKDAVEKAKRQHVWRNVTVAAKGHVKGNLLAALQTDKAGLGRSVAQCVAAVAVCELENEGWQELMPFLTEIIADPKSVCKQSSLEAIGYICEETTAESLDVHTARIVGAIVCAMKNDQPNGDVRVAAASAFQNSLGLFHKHFQTTEERDYIMQIVCEATQAEDVRLRTAAMQCIIQIVQLYYKHMKAYVATGLVPISCRAMSSTDSDEVALQGIEFWSALCDEEIRIKYEIDLATQVESLQTDKVLFNFVSTHLGDVVPCLLQWLSRQSDEDEEEWIPAKSAGVALMLIAQCVKDEIVQPVLSFIVANIQSPDWHFRDAACVAFGAILDGPDASQLKGVVDEAYDHILRMMHDVNVCVKDSAAWVVQRMCLFIGTAQNMSTQRILETLLVLQENLGGVPRVAANVCWALGALASVSTGKERQATSALSQVFTPLLADLFKVSFRGDSMQNNLRTAAYDAINQLIMASPQDCYLEVQKTAILLYNYLNNALEEGVSMTNTQRGHYGDYCQHWFTVLETILRRLTLDDVKNVRVNVVNVSLRTLDLHRTGNSFQAEPEALLSLLTLMDLEPKEFSGNLEVLQPYIIAALCNFSEHTIVNGALSLVSEICRHYETGVLRFVSSYVEHITALISQLNDPSGLVKPHAICTLGDIALSMGAQFFPFAVKSFECLRTITVPQDDDVWMAVLDSILEACVGIVQSLQAERNEDGRIVMRAYANFIVPMITAAAQQLVAINEGCVANCAVLMNLLCSTFGREMLPAVDRAEIFALLTRGKQLKGTATKKICSATMKELNRLKETITNPDAVAR